MNIYHQLATLFLFSGMTLLLSINAVPTSAQTLAESPALAPVLAPARADILAIDTQVQDRHVEIRIRLSAAPSATIAHFSTVDPPRIILDLANTDNASGSPGRKLDLQGVRGYHIARSEGRSRIVINLTQMRTYAIRTEGDNIVLSLQAAPARLPSSTSQPRILPPLKNIDFRRGPQGQARIIVDLPGAATTLNVRRQGKQLIADLIDTGLPPALQRSLDVSDFATPVRTVRSTQDGANVRMLIDADGVWEHHAYQTESQLVIELHAPAADARHAQPDYRGDKLSLNFQHIEVRALLQVLADFTGLNIIASDSVSGSLTLRLNNVPWDQALDIVLQARGLDMRRNGSVIWIAPHAELLAKEKLELEQRAQIAELEPLLAEVFQLSYQKAEAFRKVLGINEDSQPGNLGSYSTNSNNSNNSSSAGAERRHGILSRRGSAVADQRSNQLFVNDTPTVLANVRKLLEKIDIPARQVLIEARIVEADDSFSRNLGVRLGFAAKNNGAAVGNTYNSVGEAAGLSRANPAAYTASRAVNLPAQAIGSAIPGSFALSLFDAAAYRFLSLELSALEADGNGKIVSSPRVVTADQQAALIEQGEEIPYQQATSSGATSTAFKKANLKLEVTPQITPDGNILLNVDINKDSRGTVTPGGLAINTKHVKTLVQVESGGTVVIGGIYTQTEASTESKIPWLGDIPILGHLFKNTARIRDKTELLIFLTPKIVPDRAFQR